MRPNWTFRVGVVLFVAVGLVFTTGSPVALCIVGVACIGCLLAGLFRYAVSDLGVVQLVLYTLLTAFLTVIAGRALFAAMESLTRDTSADPCVGYLILAAWIGALAALTYGITRRVRERGVG
jgi:hypothetical protein